MTVKAVLARAWVLGGLHCFSQGGGAMRDWSENIFAAYQPRPPAVRAGSALAAGFLLPGGDPGQRGLAEGQSWVEGWRWIVWA